MKILKYILSIVLLLGVIFACTEEDFGSTDFANNITTPTNIVASYNITQDNTGLVTIHPTGDGASRFIINFGDETQEEVELKVGETVEHVYNEGVYDVEIQAFNLKGDQAIVTQELVVSFNAPENLEVNAAIDDANPFIINVSAEADLATSYLVYFDTSDGTEEPTPFSSGEVVSFEYPAVGDYTIKVVALSGGAQTTEYEELITISTPTGLPLGFEVFDASVLGDFGGAFIGVIDNPDTNGNETSKVAQIVKGGPETWAGNVITLSSPIDFSTETIMKMNVWSPRPGGKVLMKLENLDNSDINMEVEVTTTGNSSWEEVTFDFSSIDTSQTYQKIVLFFDIGIVGDGSSDWTFYIDDISQSIPVSDFDDGLLTNGDFESGNNSWTIGGGDDLISTDNIIIDGDNTYYSVNVLSAGNPWDINMSQKVEIIDGTTYTLTFDAWSDVDREIITGIGLSADPWSSAVETVGITSTRTTYSITLNAAGFGASDARVIFDLGANAGLVNIDNVSLEIGTDNIVQNGDYELGNSSWTIGGGDDLISTDYIITDGDNTYYSVNVASAGNPWDVNMSQKVEIIDGTTYTLTFDAWSDVDRDIVAGIGLSADPWSSAVEIVGITATRTTYSLTLNAAGFGAPDARVIFDLGANAGIVNIDNVYLYAN